MKRELIIDITSRYANSDLTLDELAKEFKLSYSMTRRYVYECIYVDKKLYKKAIKKISNNKGCRNKKIRVVTLSVFETLKVKEISRKDLIDWWLDNVQDNYYTVEQILAIANKSGIKVIKN